MRISLCNEVVRDLDFAAQCALALAFHHVHALIAGLDQSFNQLERLKAPARHQAHGG